MFRNGNNEEYIESYDFNSDEEAVLEEEENIIITALFQAIEDGSLNVIEDLFNAYAIDINKPNYEANNGELALQVACGLGNIKIVEILIQNNAQINLTDTHGETGLHCASRDGHSSIIKYLYEQGADVNIQNKTGETPVHLACRFGHVDALLQLCKCGANVNLVDEHGETGLHAACFFGFPKIVEVLGEVGINTNVQNNDLESALHVSAVRGHFECVNVLLETGVNLNLLDKNGCTALHLALRRYHTEIAILLIKYKCNIEIKDTKKQTALHLACATNQKKVVDHLCKANCNLNVQNVFNETPLHLAIKSNNLSIIRRLCAAGCDLTIQDSKGNLPKDLIKEKPAYELEDSEEKEIKDEILKLLETLMDSQIKCKLVGMLKPVLNYYDDKSIVKDLVKVNNSSNKNLSTCLNCFSAISAVKKPAKCCNTNQQCVNLSSNDSLPCCNSISGIVQNLSFKQSTDQPELNLSMISSIPKHLLKFNLKVLGDCASGKSTLIETLKCGYLASWFRTTSSANSHTNRTNSISSFNYSNHNGNNLTKTNGSNDKTVLSSISTLISSKSSLDYSGTPQSNSAINSINSSSILSVNSDYLSSTNSSNFNLNGQTNLNGNHHNSSNFNNQSNYHLHLNNRKNSAINSDICNLKTLNKELSVSDGLHPTYKQDLNKVFTSFDMIDYSRIGLNHLNQANNHVNHKLEDCTLGINIQSSVSVPNVGDLAIWEFSGHPNFLQMYNKFLNDQDDAFYMICFNATDSFDKQFTSLCYWLDLLKSVIHVNHQLNFKGNLKRKMNVCLVATHRDLATKKSVNELNLENLDKNIIDDLSNLNLRLTTSCLDNLNVLYCLLKQKYEQVFYLGDSIHFLDSRVANSNEIKLIKQQLDNYKCKFAITLQPINHFLEELIKKLSILRKESFNSPIISYSEFVSLIRDQINILVEDEYIDYAFLQLEKLGEILRLRNNHLDTQDLIIYDLKWLGSDIIGSMLNSSYLDNNGKITGHYSVEDLQSLFPDIDALDLFLILENLELCTPCESEGSFLYLFPCFIKLGKPEISWNEEKLDDQIITNGHNNQNGIKSVKQDDDSYSFNQNYIYIGLRIQCDDNCYPKHLIVCLFPRIQILFERCFQASIFQDNLNELKLIHWGNGMKISYFDLEAIISLGFLAFSLDYDSIEIKVRSNKENKADCFRLFELLVNLIEQYVNLSFPNLQLQRSYYSPFELNCKRKFLYRYSSDELANCIFKNRLSTSENESDLQRNNPLKEQIKNKNCDINESIADIISCGIEDLDRLDFNSENFLVNTIREFFESFLINNTTIRNELDLLEKENGFLNESKDEILNDENDKDDFFKPILITNYTVKDLDVLTRQFLCKLLDPPDQLGHDWCMLSIRLNLTEKLPILDSKRTSIRTSPTLRLLEEFSKEPNCSLQILLTKLSELNRKDAIELIFKLLPLVKIFPIKDPKLRPLLAYDQINQTF